ncbi:OTU domain-containing protein 4 isoform 2-T2 [Odontesthes bonariensis]|uniref:OTU domain-containing protein 4 isoform X2 n=1 Tax=Odontesthes bonariensis TaxID=219752 RepID=UPI003F58B2B0
MDSGGNMQSNEERGAEKLMDNYLKSIGLHRKKIAKDGSCLFRAVAEQVLNCQSLHTEVRAKCVEFLKKNRDSYEAFIEGDFDEYLYKLQDPQQWVGEVEINALAVIYKRDFLIFQEPGRTPVKITDNNFEEQVQLCFLNGNHYDSVYPVSHIKSAALCQSILYELLYERVFKVDRRTLQPCQRVGRPSNFLSDDSMAACGSSDESDVDVQEPLWVEHGTTSSRHSQNYRGRGRGQQLPERVKRSLNPTLLRNVEYDVWHKSKKAQQKMDYGIAAAMQFTVGDRCQVREGKGRSYSATIKEVAPGNGMVTVHIEDVGKKQVPLWSLRPPSVEQNSWSTVVNRDRRLSNGHGEWEERGKGRGRGKSIPAPSSVSQETAAGTSGRMQKQNSWPPQASEQGGGKTIRKSMSTTESALSLTEKHLAKEAEETNMEPFKIELELELKDEKSFPALGFDGARKKGGEKRQPLRNKTKSPVEDIGSTAPVATTSAPSAPSTNSTTATNPTLPAALSANSNSAYLNSLKASLPSVNMASAASGSASSRPPTSAAKTNAQSYASAAAAPASPPPAATLSTKPILSPTSHPSFVTPFLPAASSPPAPSTLSSSSHPTFAPSPPPSSVSPPTFIAPIAPSPTAAQVFPRSFSPLTSLPHSPSPPSSSSLIPPSVQVKEAPPAQPTNSLPKTEGTLASETFQSWTPLTQMLPQGSLPQNPYQVPASRAEKETQHSLSESHPESRASISQSEVTMPQMQTESWSSVPQHRPQSHTEAASEPQTLQPQSEVVHIPSSHPLPGASHPIVQPPHPSQVPHPSLSFSASTTLSSLESASTQTQPEAPTSPPPKPQSPSQPPSLPPAQPSHPQSAPPLPHLQSIVPLQQMSQIYQDLLYPGFPQGEKGEMASIPSYSSIKSGDDLPQDVNILRFFFNLGVKAYSMPMFAPYLYLLPLQQTYTMHPKPSSHSPSPQYPPSNPPARQQEACMPPQYPPTSVSVPSQYNNQTSMAESPNPSEPTFSQAGYQAVTQPPSHGMSSPLMPWQQMPPPRNSSFPVGYPSPPPPYSGPPPSSQGYHPGQGPVHSIYPSATPQYPPFAMGYQSSSTPEELQVTQGVMEPLQPTNGDQMPGHGHVRVLGPLDSPGAANVANANNRRMVVSPNYALKEAGDGTTRVVLLVDPPLDNKPIGNHEAREQPRLSI